MDASEAFFATFPNVEGVAPAARVQGTGPALARDETFSIIDCYRRLNCSECRVSGR